MTEQLLRLVSLNELNKVRIICKVQKPPDDKSPTLGCGRVFEMRLDQLPPNNQGVALLYCPYCQNPFYLTDDRKVQLDPFGPLVKAINDLESLKNKMELQFAIDTDGKA